jgi:signal transduction histidine kinase
MTPPPRGSTEPLVIAVRGGDIVQEVRKERELSGNTIVFRVEPGDPPDPTRQPEWMLPLGGEIAIKPADATLSESSALGDRFPGLRIGFPVGQGPSVLRSQSFYAVSLSVVLSLTLLGSYLLLRDVRRESRLAELRSQFVSSVSHELKTPLTAIRMFAETLQMHDSTDPQIQKEFLNTIVSESERLTRLLNNVLDFSRIERGQRNYHLVPTPMADVVRSAARTMQFPLSEQGFEFHVDVCDGLPLILLDRDALEQAILNLLSNAMKYSGNSRVIALKLRSENASALVQVVDHGIGIAPQERKRIFETFYRVASPENRAISGYWPWSGIDRSHHRSPWRRR